MSKPIPKLFLVTYTEEHICLWRLPADDPEAVMKLPTKELNDLIRAAGEEMGVFTLDQAKNLRSQMDRCINLFKRQKLS